jgi:hypothetical protein
MAEDPPPPYPGHGHGHSRLTVRLQVWHFTDLGRQPRYNQDLAHLFNAGPGLQDWQAQAAPFHDPNDRDQFVPVEVL